MYRLYKKLCETIVKPKRADLTNEMCIRDRASGVHTAWRGKFLAFTQQGTTLSSDGIHPTCLNYLKRLGVSYVQLMPIFDFGSVDESRPLTRQYNWGYDPANFNVPEGSYSTDPTRGEVRVRECKQMIAALHAAGIGVVMDVVYNHMYRSDNVLNRVVPLYYFRQNDDGSLSNGSGCGNEFASERPMARRYLIDSVLYWAREYHIDGFRFDLMGLYLSLIHISPLAWKAAGWMRTRWKSPAGSTIFPVITPWRAITARRPFLPCWAL